jgi:hypothetical protein
MPAGPARDALIAPLANLAAFDLPAFLARVSATAPTD